MNPYNFCMSRAKRSSSPIKYKILVHIMFNGNEKNTARHISKALKIKLSTVRTYLNILFHEAEINKRKWYHDKNQDKLIHTNESVYFIESEWNEQPTIISGLFMTAKEYSEFKKSKTWTDEVYPMIKEGRIKIHVSY